LEDHTYFSGNFQILWEDQIKEIIDCKFARFHHSGDSIARVLKNEGFWGSRYSPFAHSCPMNGSVTSHMNIVYGVTGILLPE
jgi:hypothetical protein